jgi:hypothetical protein
MPTPATRAVMLNPARICLKSFRFIKYLLRKLIFMIFPFRATGVNYFSMDDSVRQLLELIFNDNFIMMTARNKHFFIRKRRAQSYGTAAINIFRTAIDDN